MSIITISRGTLSGGKMLAECLAASLGYRCVDRDVIVERAAAHGVSQETLREALSTAPSLLERFQHKRFLYLSLIQGALIDELGSGKVIYHGNAGHLLIRGGAHVLRVRIIAPMEFRIRMAMERRKMERGEALSYIRRADEERRKWAWYLYGVDWSDPALYDLVLNLEHYGICDACEIVSEVASQRRYDFTPGCEEVMQLLALASRARIALATDASTSFLELDTVVKDGNVRLQGRVCMNHEIERIKRVLSEVPGLGEYVLDDVLPAPIV